MGQKQKLIFPKNFLWGAAISAYQTEGGNSNSDWWEWEHSQKRARMLSKQGKNPEEFFSGIACDFYNRYEEDFSAASRLNHNSVRIGIEWSRIEPEDGKFDEAAFNHYEKILQSAKANGLNTFVTLHHFTNPLWFLRRGGFEKRQNVGLFLRYVQKAARRLYQYVDFWITINEPEIYSSHGYYFGKYPPNQKNFLTTYKVTNNLIRAHNEAYNRLHLIGGTPVGMCNQLPDIEAVSFASRPLRYAANYIATRYILSRTVKNCDFIGLNYYIRQRVGWFGLKRGKYKDDEMSDLGWELYPAGIERVLLDLKKNNKPIYITENGLADSKDSRREKFIKDHLYYAHRAVSQGVDLRGYLHWSLTDNFEWTEGFAPRFGLIEINRQDGLRRVVRPSALSFAEICKNNYLEY